MIGYLHGDIDDHHGERESYPPDKDKTSDEGNEGDNELD